MTRPKISGKFYPLQHEEFLQLSAQLKDAQLRVYLYLVTLEPFGDREIEIDTAIIAERLGMVRRTIQRALRRLEELELLDLELYGLDSNKNYVESQVRERLKSQLGGLAEVKTPAGRIDLLTETEIIEVKRIGEWKSALGQILVYSGFYPEHKRRLHLFGYESDEKQIPTIANSCLAFDVSVSFEMVGVEA